MDAKVKAARGRLAGVWTVGYAEDNMPRHMFRNIKTKSLYFLLYDEATCTTNGTQNGQVMVVYADATGRVFCRKRSEFYEKFEPYFD